MRSNEISTQDGGNIVVVVAVAVVGRRSQPQATDFTIACEIGKAPTIVLYIALYAVALHDMLMHDVVCKLILVVNGRSSFN